MSAHLIIFAAPKHKKKLCKAPHKCFKQIKQDFPLRYFYGESANAIKIQIWVTLIANLLLSLLQSSLERNWSFSGLATMVRIVLMYYLNLQTFFNQPDADLKIMLAEASEEAPPGNTSIEQGGCPET